MRVLLDEQLDRRLKPLFDPELTVITVAERGWASMPDGELLRAASTSSARSSRWTAGFRTSRT